MIEANEFIDLNKLYAETPKQVFIDNIIMVFANEFPSIARIYPFLGYITESSAYTVSAWFNKSREDVRCPLIKLCQICSVFDLSLNGMMSTETSWYTDEMKVKVHKIVERIKNEISKND